MSLELARVILLFLRSPLNVTNFMQKTACSVLLRNRLTSGLECTHLPMEDFESAIVI